MSNSDLNEYLWVCLYCLWIVSPVLLCCCFPAERVINRFEKELLSANLGTICGFIFFEIVPVIIRHNSGGESVQTYINSCTIMLGMLFGFFLGILHRMTEDHHHEHNDSEIQNPSDSAKNPENKGCLSCMSVHAII